LLCLGDDASDAEMDYQYLLLENSNGRRSELTSILKKSRQTIRLSDNMMLPSRESSIEFSTPLLADEVVSAAVLQLQNDSARFSAAVKEKYRYALINHNCVTELVMNLNRSFSDSDAVKDALGDYIDPRTDRVTVPHDFFYQVSLRYHIEKITRYPSRRIETLESMSMTESSLTLWLREGNTKSSTIYRKRQEDTPFLFFTDNSTWSRPVLGIANLTWAAVSGISGIVTLPADGGERMYQGARGIMYSLPELLFFNIRKGTYQHDALSTSEHQL
jgi:hypothetical protein